jgi:hypothetical protein
VQKQPVFSLDNGLIYKTIIMHCHNGIFIRKIFLMKAFVIQRNRTLLIVNNERYLEFMSIVYILSRLLIADHLHLPQYIVASRCLSHADFLLDLLFLILKMEAMCSFEMFIHFRHTA